MFSSKCLVPGILLLHECLGSTAKTAKYKNIVIVLERLLALHVFIPARASFISGDATTEPDGEDSHSPKVPLLLRRYLETFHARVVNMRGEASRPPVDVRLLRCIPLLFLTAIRTPYPATFKDQSQKTAWLEAVFVSVLEISRVSLDGTSNDEINQDQYDTMRELLRIAIERKVGLGTDLLRNLVLRYANLFAEDEKDIRWWLVESILQLDADVFLVAIHDDPVPEDYRERGNPLLEQLFHRMTSAAASQLLLERETPQTLQQQQQQQHIFIRLIEELSKARALNSFLKYWYECLVTIKEKELCTDQSGPSIRPDISLLESQPVFHRLRDLLERSLTPTQIAGELDRLVLVISSLTTTPSTNIQGQVSASLVVVDAILGSLSQEDTVNGLIDQALALYKLILELAQADDVLDKWQGWHLWRILQWLHVHWPRIHSRSHPNNQYDANGLLEGVIAIISTMFRSVGQSKGIHLDEVGKYLCVYESFGFLLTVINKPIKAVAVWRDILEGMVVSMEQWLDEDVPIGEYGQDHVGRTRWNGDFGELASRQQLTLALVARLVLQYPGALL